MSADREVSRDRSFWRQNAWLLVLASAGVRCLTAQVQAAPSVVVWDTGAPLPATTAVENRAGWTPVPRDLLTLEADPAKATMDPGYHGREYAFTGDAVVENQSLTALFWSAQGRVVIRSKSRGSTSAPAPAHPAPLTQTIVEIVPLQTAAQPARIGRCDLLRHAADEVVLGVTFSAPASADAAAVFVFGKTDVVEMKPADTLRGVSVRGGIEYGIVPSFVGDDLIYAATEYPATDTVWVPAENIFMGLLAGEEAALVLTWPTGRQRLKLRPAADPEGRRRIKSLDFENDGQSLYLAVLSAPGIWHQEILAPAYLEKDVKTAWKRPFPARWKTQLLEGDVRTTFAFRESRGQIWRGVPGSYIYPVWFSGEDAFYHLSKKVPPKGQSVVYFLEGQDTPADVSTPVDILKSTLGRLMADPILDTAGRRLRTHHRRGAEGVRRACTCGCTEVIQSIFEAGEEVARQAQIKGALEDMMFFVRRHVERIDEYRQFAHDLTEFLRARASSVSALKPFLEKMEQIAQQIPHECSVQEENMKSLGYAEDLVRQTLALTARKDPDNLKAYMELLKAWRAMGGAQDYVVAQCHTITRTLCQEAGHACADQPEAVELAKTIRARCRQCLRNPDGYEIWAEY